MLISHTGLETSWFTAIGRLSNVGWSLYGPSRDEEWWCTAPNIPPAASFG